jgi:secreted PhoX family phosphatase
MDSNSPVRYIYAYASDVAKNGEVVIPVFSADREVGDTRFARLEDFAAEGVKVQVFSAKEMEGVSGTRARQALQANDRTSWELLMPKHVKFDTKEQLWELFAGPGEDNKQFDLEKTIAEELDKFDEISAMAAGSIEGHNGNPDDEEDEEKETLIREVMNYLLA